MTVRTPKNTQTGRLKVNLQAWCILEESESEQWQEVISRRSRQRAKRTNQASLLSVESSYDLSPKKIVEEKDKWVKVRATMDAGAAGHVMPEAMFPHVKIERKTPSKKFVAANGEQIKDLGAKRHNVQECEYCQTPHFNAKSRPSWEHCCAGFKESTHSKHWKLDGDQVGREQWCVHDGHVDLP